MKRPILYEKRFKQSIIFDGLQDGLVSPTDIDFCFEVGNKFLLIGDCKKDDAPFPTGQRLVIERIVDNWRATNKVSLGVIATHSTSAEQSIMLANTVVTKVYYNGEWKKTFMVFDELVKRTAERFDIEKLKLACDEILKIKGFDTSLGIPHFAAIHFAETKRVASVIFYLNDLEYGGETEFPVINKSFRPKQGRMVIFPPYYTHLHYGRRAPKDKYVITGHLVENHTKKPKENKDG